MPSFFEEIWEESESIRLSYIRKENDKLRHNEIGSKYTKQQVGRKMCDLWAVNCHCWLLVDDINCRIILIIHVFEVNEWLFGWLYIYTWHSFIHHLFKKSFLMNGLKRILLEKSCCDCRLVHLCRQIAQHPHPHHHHFHPSRL